MNNEVKYYEFFLTGEIIKDPATGVPLKNEDGSIKVRYTKQTIPTKALLDAGLTSNNWFQCEAVEVNIEEDLITSASGKKWDIGPAVNKGTTVNIFYNTQKEVYKAIIERFSAGKFTVVQPPEEGDPIIHLTNWALPGRVVDFATGFPYFVMNRNKVTKKLERLQKYTYNSEGKLLPEDVIKTTGTLFLFANELPAMEAHIKNAIADLEQFKCAVPQANEKKEDVITNQQKVEAPATTAVVEGATPPAEKLVI